MKFFGLTYCQPEAMPLISISLYIIEIKQVKVCLQAIQNQITNKRKVVVEEK